MTNTLEYKGLNGSVEYSKEDDCLFGKILLIDDLILYEGNSLAELKQDFEQAVDEYIEECEQEGKTPRVYKGTFNVRIGGELHKKLALKAESENNSLNSAVIEAVEKYIA